MVLKLKEPGCATPALPVLFTADYASPSRHTSRGGLSILKRSLTPARHRQLQLYNCINSACFIHFAYIKVSESHLAFVFHDLFLGNEMIAKATDHKEMNFTGGTDVSPIVDVLYGSLYQFAVRLTRSESDAADLVQQTFLTLIQRLHQIRDYSKIKYWLFTTLRRNFLIEVRRRRKYSEVEFLPDVHDFEAADPEAWRSLDAQRLREALLQVEPMYGTALELFYRSNLSYREIGKALEIPIGTVMSRLSRGKAQLRSILSTSFYA